MRHRNWLSLGLIFVFARLAAAETPGPSVFNSFDDDQTYYAFMAGDGRTLAGTLEENGAKRGIVRVWDGAAWIRGYLDDATGIHVIPRAASADGRMIAGRTQARTHPSWTRASVWELGDTGWTRTDLTLDETYGSAFGVSDDGNVILGTIGDPTWGRPCVWERTETGWTHTLLPKLDGDQFLTASWISADGRVVAGDSAQSDSPYRRRGVVWRRAETGWNTSVLPADEPLSEGSSIHALSRDGQTVIGRMLKRGTVQTSGFYAWTWDGSTWRWSRLPELVRNQEVEAWEISRDGLVAIGTAYRSENTPPVRAAWKKSEAGVWTLAYAGSLKEVDDFPGQLTEDGKLAFAQPGLSTWRLWNLVNGKLLTLQSLVANLDLGAEPGWDFSEGQLDWQAYSALDNTYTLIGWGRKNGVGTTFAISLYAPFLTGENPTIGGWIDVELPDMGAEGYRMTTALPPGLTYNAKTRRISGRVTQVGNFTVKYRNLATGRAKESLLKVVPFSRKLEGIRTLALTSTTEPEKSPGLLKVKTSKYGGVAAHLVLPGDNKKFSFSGTLVPDAETGLFVLKTRRGASETGVTLRRGAGARAVRYRLEVQMTKTGALTAQVLAADGTLIAENVVAP